MNRADVYKVINSERDYQDLKYGGRECDKKVSMGNWILYMEKFLSDAKKALYENERFECRANIRKIAGLAVACMEQFNVEPREVVNKTFKIVAHSKEDPKFPGIWDSPIDIYLDTPLLKPGYIIAPVIHKRYGIQIHTDPIYYGSGCMYTGYLINEDASFYLPSEFLQPEIEYILIGIKDTPWERMTKNNEIQKRKEFLAGIKEQS